MKFKSIGVFFLGALLCTSMQFAESTYRTVLDELCIKRPCILEVGTGYVSHDLLEHAHHLVSIELITPTSDLSRWYECFDYLQSHPNWTPAVFLSNRYFNVPGVTEVFNGSHALATAVKFQEARGYAYATVNCTFIHELNRYLDLQSDKFKPDVIVINMVDAWSSYLAQMSFNKARIVVARPFSKEAACLCKKIVTAPGYIEILSNQEDGLRVWVKGASRKNDANIQ